jgi:hypothetical protein
VFGRASGGAYAYGIYGFAGGASSFNAAGYFDGAVWVRTYNTLSDRKFKQNIVPVKHELEQVLKLKPSVYTFKTEEYKGMHLPEGKQLGLIADEVKEVFPELVSKAVHPAEYDEEDRTKIISPEVKYEGVNYQGLIPVLVASVQQLNEKDKEIDALKTEMAELRQIVLELKKGRTGTLTSNGAYLEQNSPNPARKYNNTLPCSRDQQFLPADAYKCQRPGGEGDKPRQQGDRTGELKRQHSCTRGLYLHLMGRW